jgi:hypothetical protein
MPLCDDSAKVGLGLWNRPLLAFGLEAALLFGGLVLFLRHRAVRSAPPIVFSSIMLATQASVFFSPPPPSDVAVASMALGAYVIFAVVAGLLFDRRRVGHGPSV